MGPVCIQYISTYQNTSLRQLSEIHGFVYNTLVLIVISILVHIIRIQVYLDYLNYMGVCTIQICTLVHYNYSM